MTDTTPSWADHIREDATDVGHAAEVAGQVGAVAVGATAAAIGAAEAVSMAATVLAGDAPAVAATELLMGAEDLAWGLEAGAVGTVGVIGAVVAGGVVLGAEHFPVDENKAAGIEYNPNDTASHDINSSVDDGMSHAPPDGWE